MLQSEILDVIYIRVRDNMPTEVPAGRLFTASTNPDEQSVTKPKVVIFHEPTTSDITTLGSSEVCRRFERGGTVRISVRTPLTPYTEQLGLIIGEQIQSLFEGNAEDAPLHYDNVTVRSTGRNSSVEWITTVVITYRLDVVK